MPNRTVGIIRLSRLVLGLALVWSGAAYADDLSLSEAIASARLHDKEYLSASTLTDSADAWRAQAGSL